MALSSTLKAALVVGILGGMLAVVGFVLGLIAYLREDEVVETTQAVTLENHTDLYGATTTSGTFVPTLQYVPVNSFVSNDHGASAVATDLSALSVVAGTTGTWRQIGKLIYLQATVRWDLSGGLPGAPAVPGSTNEVRMAFVSGDQWPIAKSAGTFHQFNWQHADDQGNQYSLQTTSGQQVGVMLSNGIIALTQVPDSGWASRGTQYVNFDDGIGGGSFNSAIPAASWIEFRVQGIYEIP